MSYVPDGQVRSLYNRLAEAANDPYISLVYEEYATEFYVAYMPSAFNLTRLANSVAETIVREYPDAPACIFGTIEPSKEKTVYSLFFERPAERQILRDLIGRMVKQECSRTDTPFHLGDYSFYTSRDSQYQSVNARLGAQKGPNAAAP